MTLSFLLFLCLLYRTFTTFTQTCAFTINDSQSHWKNWIGRKFTRPSIIDQRRTRRAKRIVQTTSNRPFIFIFEPENRPFFELSFEFIPELSLIPHKPYSSFSFFFLFFSFYQLVYFPSNLYETIQSNTSKFIATL